MKGHWWHPCSNPHAIIPAIIPAFQWRCSLCGNDVTKVIERATNCYELVWSQTHRQFRPKAIKLVKKPRAQKVVGPRAQQYCCSVLLKKRPGQSSDIGVYPKQGIDIILPPTLRVREHLRKQEERVNRRPRRWEGVLWNAILSRHNHRTQELIATMVTYTRSSQQGWVNILAGSTDWT